MGNLEKVARAQGSDQCALTICPRLLLVKQFARDPAPLDFLGAGSYRLR
jgi:hypothetical protein